MIGLDCMPWKGSVDGRGTTDDEMELCDECRDWRHVSELERREDYTWICTDCAQETEQ